MDLSHTVERCPICDATVVMIVEGQPVCGVALGTVGDGVDRARCAAARLADVLQHEPAEGGEGDGA